MTKEEALKYLQQLYPNSGHCWLDEQRMEAIDMAVKALQEEPKAKFKKGDTIRYTDGDIRTVVEVREDCYKLDDFSILHFNAQDNWELVREPVSNDFEMALAEMIDKAQTSVVEPLVVAAQWKDELIKLAKSEEPVSKVWHDISEEPEPCKRYVWVNGTFAPTISGTFSRSTNSISWNEYVEENSIRKWAYVDDLLKF